MNLQLTAMNLQVTKKSKSRLIPGVCNDDYFIWTPVCQAALIHYPVNKTFTGKPLIYVYAHWIGMKEPLLMGVLKAEFRHILPS